MYNAKLYDKILNVSCTISELEKFVTNLDKKKFDVDNAFNKYYSLDRVLYAISLYENKIISNKFLVYWADAYNWIIMAGFNEKYMSSADTFKDWLEWEISDWLDSLSFFDEECDCFDIGLYKTNFNELDKMYNNVHDWKSCIALSNDYEDEFDVILLAFNDKTKEYLITDEIENYYNDFSEIKRIESSALKLQLKKLEASGYVKK